MSNRTVTGGTDKNIVIFDKEEEKIVCTLKGILLMATFDRSLMT